MASITDPQSDQPSEELVAYLDGELPPEECRRIEERLAQDADYRQQLHDLDQAWEALDVLPGATVDDNFARTTIEMVAVAAEQDLSQRAAHTAAANRKGLRLWAISGLAAAIAAFGFIRAVVPDENDRLLADLPVIRQFDHLSQIEDVKFLRNLPTVVPLEDLAQDAAAVDSEVADVTAAAASSLAQRREWVESLSPEEKAGLASQAKRFEDLAQRSPQEEMGLRQLEREIGQDEHVEQLRKTMVIYSRWLAQRPPGDQEDLRVLSDDKRLEAVEAIVRREDEEAARHLSAQDAAALRDEIFEIFRERESDFRKAMRRRERDNRPPLDGPRARLALIFIHWELRNDSRDDETTERLVDVLSDEAQEYWKRQRHRRFDRRRLQLLQWISEAMRPRWGAKELEQFFTNELDTNQKERLLSLPRDEMQAQLERLFVEDRLGFTPSDEWPGRFGEAERFPPGPPGQGRPDARPREFPRPEGPPLRGGDGRNERERSADQRRE